jgi:hypothetical protein
MILELPIFCHNDKTNALRTNGKEIDFELFDVKFCTFYHIHAISPFELKGIEYAELYIGDNRFITPLTYKELKLQIESE